MRIGSAAAGQPYCVGVTGPSSYLLCGTPRTGSTLLCDLLASTGVAGHPASYFREPDQRDWASRLGVQVMSDGGFDYRDFVERVKREGTTSNGVFAARIMWGTMSHLVHGLSRPSSAGPDLALLNDAFGPLVFVHLRRADVVRQAVSWARAERTGYWQPGDAASGEPELDLDLVAQLVRTVHGHNAAWSEWFAGQGVSPFVVTYENLVARPRSTVDGILARLGVVAPASWQPGSSLPRQADELSEDWVRRYHRAHR